MTVKLPPFQALLDAHARDVHRFLTTVVGVTDADDCYQETWLAALRAYPRLRDDSNLRGWILTIAHHKALDHLRARARRAVPVADVASVEQATVGPGRANDGLWAAVAALPDKQRAAIALRFIADLAYADIAAAMRTSPEAARRSVHEGLTQLRRDPTP